MKILVFLVLFASVAAAQNSDDICIAADQTGANAGEKIAACEAQLPATGGVVDATGLTGNQTIAALTVVKGAVIKLGCGIYNVTSPINMANLGPWSGARIGGCMSSSEGSINTVGTVLVGNTGSGNPVIDTTGSGSIYLSHFSVRPGTSDVGILQARSTTASNVERDFIEDVHIDMGSNPAANGGNGRIGIYNYGAELPAYTTIQVGADKPVVLTLSNIYGIASPFASYYTGRTTMSSATLNESDLYSYSGSGLYLIGASHVRVHAGEIAQPAPLVERYAVWADQAVVDAVIDTNAENYYRMLRIGGQFVSSQLLGTCGSCGQIGSEPVVYLENNTGEARAGDISNSLFNVYYAPNVPHNFLTTASDTSGWNATGWELHMMDLAGIHWYVPGWLTGTIYYDGAWRGDNVVGGNFNATIHDNAGGHFEGNAPTFSSGMVIGSAGTVQHARQTVRVTGNPLCTAGPNSNCTFKLTLPNDMPDNNWGANCVVENSYNAGIIQAVSTGRTLNTVMVYFYNLTASDNSLTQAYCEAWE